MLNQAVVNPSIPLSKCYSLKCKETDLCIIAEVAVLFVALVKEYCIVQFWHWKKNACWLASFWLFLLKTDLHYLFHYCLHFHYLPLVAARLVCRLNIVVMLWKNACFVKIASKFFVWICWQTLHVALYLMHIWSGYWFHQRSFCR